MDFTFAIERCVAWGAGLTSEQDWQQFAKAEPNLVTAELTLPLLQQIPAMQRRRLSPFAKLALHCAMTAAEGHCDYIDSVFSSRHGDLPRTAELIRGVADQEPLSPTQFGLSVHNAAAGLFSIYTGNTAPITATAAGEQSFIAGLVDALAKLTANRLERLLYVHTDLQVPDIYQPYVSAQEQPIAVALLLSPGNTLKLEPCSMAHHPDRHQALSFLNYFYNDTQPTWQAQLGQQGWQLSTAN